MTAIQVNFYFVVPVLLLLAAWGLVQWFLRRAAAEHSGTVETSHGLLRWNAKPTLLRLAQLDAGRGSWLRPLAIILLALLIGSVIGVLAYQKTVESNGNFTAHDANHVPLNPV